ncbi:Glucagon-like peptide 1 receptor [Willisornis vidua]|uniref:Glucagon-like peptide 1 receptor n=1 Tax=Willisornis vidua TaxID=1566151 RepID=A0ABQ9CUX1_9PASS|nr:Glucagon-like peptide 1 receptor [Willisornis vidua]
MDDGPRRSQCPELEDHDCKNYQLHSDTVLDLQFQLDPYKSVGPDGIHPRILKELTAVIGKTLLVLSSLENPEGFQLTGSCELEIMCVVKPTQRQRKLFQAVAAEWSADVLEHVPSDPFATACPSKPLWGPENELQSVGHRQGEVPHGQVYRFCTLEGTWLLKENSTVPWRNLSECESSDQDAPEEQLLNLSIIYTIGYALSFSALVIATAILLGFRHLHCTRNYIHLNLFTSFILRAISVFIKDSVVKWMYSTATQEHQWEGLIAFQESLSCRLVFVMMQYCVAANYYWLLVEGMYLYTLLVLSVFSEQRIFRLYLCIGWGVPMLFVILWGTVKYLYEDEGCWTRNYNMNYWLIIRLPILIAIGVNFLIFIRVICIIISKLQANLMCKTDIKCRLAKSTLTLIPLLGTHEVIFAFITDEHARGMLRFVKLFTELSFASFQGLMVAILYCFINNEVQMEFRKSWERWRLEHLYVQRDSSMKPLKCPANSISSGGTVGSSVYAATCQATFS